MRDIVVTWPKSRRFETYLLECERAKHRGLFVNFRVPHLPDFGVAAFDYGAPPVRCYRVWDGRVRGFLVVVGAEHREFGEVERVPSDPLYHVPRARYWPSGNYIVCDPEWHPRLGPQIVGFRGWRWFARERCGAI